MNDIRHILNEERIHLGISVREIAFYTERSESSIRNVLSCRENSEYIIQKLNQMCVDRRKIIGQRTLGL